LARELSDETARRGLLVAAADQGSCGSGAVVIGSPDRGNVDQPAESSQPFLKLRRLVRDFHCAVGRAVPEAALNGERGFAVDQLPSSPKVRPRSWGC
jgi:hypothetical protein